MDTSSSVQLHTCSILWSSWRTIRCGCLSFLAILNSIDYHASLRLIGETWQDGWPLGLGALNVRAGVLRGVDMSDSASFDTTFTSSHLTSSLPSTDFDTEVIFLHCTPLEHRSIWQRDLALIENCLPSAVGLVLAALRRRRRRDAGEPDRPRGRHGEPAPTEHEGGQEQRQAQGAAAVALPPQPPGER
jgi:hypothetical protein